MTLRVALVSSAILVAGVATVTGAPTRMISISEDAEAPPAAPPERSDRCSALRDHVDRLVSRGLSGNERTAYARESAARRGAFEELCRKTRPSNKTMRCFLRADSLDAMTACSVASMPPAQRAVHQRLVRAIDSDDPAAIADAVTQSLDIDPRQAARMRSMIEQAIRDGDEQ